MATFKRNQEFKREIKILVVQNNEGDGLLFRVF